MGGCVGIIGDVIPIKMALMKVNKKLYITLSCICS